MTAIKLDTHRLSEDTNILKEDSTKFSSKLDDHVNKIYSFTKSFDKRLNNISTNNRVSSNIDAETSKLEATIEMKIDKIAAYHTKIFDSFNMKLSAITSSKPYLSYEQPSDYLIKCPLLKSPNKSSHSSQFTKHHSPMNFEGGTLLQIQKWWDAIRSALCQSLLTNKSCLS